MIATVNGNFLNIGPVNTVTNNNGPFKKLEESSDSDKNAGQNAQAPYLAELRNGLRESKDSQESAKPRMAGKDPLGRGGMFDYVA